jgi:hypothetical protein
VGLDRLELSTSPLSGVRSNHLSYRPKSRLKMVKAAEQKPCKGRPAVAARAATSHSATKRAHARKRYRRHSRRKRNEGGRSRYGMHDGMNDFHPSCSKCFERQRLIIPQKQDLSVSIKKHP